MKKLSMVVGVITIFLLSSCAKQSDRVPVIGKVVSCTQLNLSGSADGLTFPCMDGKSSVNFGTLRGPLIVNVWGSWCAPCKDEIPFLRSFNSKVQSRVQLLGIDVEEANPKNGSDFVVSQGMTWPSLVDFDGRSRSLFGMGVPVTWFIDSAGKVAYKKIGVLKSERELSLLTQKYLHLNIG